HIAAATAAACEQPEQYQNNDDDHYCRYKPDTFFARRTIFSRIFSPGSGYDRFCRFVEPLVIFPFPESRGDLITDDPAAHSIRQCTFQSVTCGNIDFPVFHRSQYQHTVVLTLAACLPAVKELCAILRRRINADAAQC